ncbi:MULTISPECIES: MBL fold metallo-hydrolase [Acinetobacter]|uniref:MBL fold metallo-hydrolase n=1 Tax=Acinetobacter TaxID=469 RepID=UPI00141BC5F1|nr:MULTISPECIES: MBL fold metallo-hydrolase [Acinetobacter]MCS4296869.1 glyoxylase-like metal-dependent hydrolase (beta-lactamase superfamily II) [Acinetobacter guillouiae]MCW2250991.1 glyoxylase-like metal-dependent hydrolase (beta-lactamase superfamily II) [Acinetobacter sp. BIGb0204]NII36911.1 glyoxylase-like metal-dependent hydrolase (beta-lactamase superfamily II) [Acinetobacter sp. BIGb0196]
MNPFVQDFFDEASNTFSYVVVDPATQYCAIIDSVLDYDAASATISTTQADHIIQYIQIHHLTVQWILETHVHADHLTASQYLKAQLGGQIAMSEKIVTVQDIFSQIYHLDYEALKAQHSFDYLFKDHEIFKIGELEAYNLPTPGHTPACLTYVIGDAAFVGDTLFMPDYGTARCDFPKGSAAQLYDSVMKIFNLAEHTRLYLCHDYLSESRQDFHCQTDINTQRKENIHIHTGVTKQAFIALREQRDATLSMPKLILPAIQINMNAGKFPEPETNGVRYLKLPLNYFR